MLQAQLRDFAQLRRELSEAARSLQPPHCLELGVRRPAGSNQIGVIRIGEPVGAGFGRSHHCLFLQSEGGVVRARGSEHSGDSVDAFGVGERVVTSLGDAQLGAFGGRGGGNRFGSGTALAANLEVRRGRRADRTGREQRPTQIGGSTAGARDDAFRRSLARDVARVHDPRPLQQLQCPRPALPETG